jgi:hypothetical protein
MRTETKKWYETRRGPIALISSDTGAMKCLKCGAEWHANIKPNSGGQFYPGAWTCHNCGANSKDPFSPDRSKK